jgi:quercetin dioxygenase-like cupin family protein
MKPYTLRKGEGRAYEWHGVLFTIKAAANETAGALSIWEVTTRPGEEPQPHSHPEDELFYVLSGAITFSCGEETLSAKDGGFVFLPRGLPHSYTIDSEEARLLGFSVPSGFGDDIERTGRPVRS